jgi:hypothetical protein
MNMSRKSRLYAVGLLSLILIICSTSLAQAPTRIKFGRGAVRATVSGTLNSFRSKRVYTIRVREGQTLRTEPVGGASRRITILLRDPNGDAVGDMDASCNDRREISPTLGGNYIIEVIECRKADPWRGRFTFRVAVR